MIPLRLELAGFSCFRVSTVVNLEELEVDLFAIAGPTGAGKSTLLDAMTYALYGQTARLGSTRLDALMSPGLDEMMVQLVFRTVAGTYRVSRFTKRRPSGVSREVRLERLEPDASWQQLPESEKIKEANDRLIQLVGLDYDGFTRAVLLPQGAFDEFLRGDANKRRGLLKSLLNLDRVEDMQRLANSRAKEAEASRKAIEVRLDEDFAGATPERRRTVRDDLEASRARRDELTARQARLEAELRELEEVAGLLADQERFEEVRQRLVAEAPAMEALASRLVRGRQARALHPLESAIDALRTRRERLEVELGALDEELNDSETRLAAAREAATASLATQRARLPELEREIAELAGVAPLLRQLRSRGGSLALADAGAPGLRYDDDAWEAHQRLAGNLPALLAERQALRTNDRARDDNARTVERGDAELATLSRQLEEVRVEGVATKEVLEAATHAYLQATLRDQASELRLHLHEGDPCPVCLREIEVVPPPEQADLAGLKVQVDDVQARRQALLERYHEVQAARDAAAKRLEELRAAKRDLDAARPALAAAVDARLEPFSAAGYTSPDTLESDLDARRRALLAALAAEIRAKTGGRDPEAAQRALAEERTALERAVREANKALTDLEKGLERQRTRASELTKQVRALADDLASQTRAFELALSRAGFERVEELKAALLDENRLQEMEATLSSYRSSREANDRRAVELQVKLAGRTLDAAALERGRSELKDVRAALDVAQQTVGRLEGELERLEQMWARAQELRRDLDLHTRRFDTYRQLALDLRSDRFQDFLMRRMQQRLAVRASHIVRTVTDGRFDLRLEDGEYQVRDAWNTGELRSARTLSGGETFIASLALALALSDTLAGSHALGALFLDEGFGTLDADTLDSVASVLEALTREGRMVGIITHVTALSERLPARLVVEKGPGGSTASWDL